MLPLLLCRFALTSATVLFAGTMTLRLLAWGTEMPRTSRWGRLAWGSWGVLLLACVLQLGLTAAEMSGQPLARTFSDEGLGSVINETSFGAVWKGRVGLLAGMLLVGCFHPTAPRRGGGLTVIAAWEFTSALLCAALLSSLVWSGHAHASDKRAWLLPVDGLHAVAAGVWPGGLLPLVFLLGRVRRDSHLAPPVMTITRRFSCLSMIAVGTLAFSGMLNGVGLTGLSPALWTSVYGRVLLCKVMLFGGMVGFGAVNRRLLRSEASGDPAQILRRLWRNVTCECVLAAGVLLASEALAMSPPPASAG